MRSALDESLHSYIARQRVERAVMNMQTEKMSLTMLAGMVGYDNPQSFSKAFKKHFGISPKAYSDKLQSRLDDYIKSRGNGHGGIHSEIIEIEKIELTYIRIFGKYGEDEPYETAWNKLLCFLEKNNALSDTTRFIGISFDDPNITEYHQCRFYACASVQQKISPAGEFGTIQIPEGKYAVYTLKGSYPGLQGLYNNIVVDFNHAIRHGIAFEEYLNSPRDVEEKDLLTKIYIPIK